MIHEASAASLLGSRMSKGTILVVEDDRDIVEVLRYNLAKDGFKVLEARDGERGFEQARRTKPDVIVLDLMLPGLDGLEVCRRLRDDEELAGIPVLMLTAKGEEADIVIGLEMGADDYVTKPFSPRELVARVRAVQRRAKARRGKTAKTRVEVHELVLDKTRHEVLAGGEPVDLTRAEFRLLWALVQRPGRVYARDELADEITGGESVIVDRNVDVHVSALRKKLGDAGRVIATVRGVGYKCLD